MLEKAIMEAMSQGLISAGLPCLLLFSALWWMNSQNKTFVEALNKERVDRLDKLEKDNDACEKDRFALRNQLIDLLKQDRTVVRALPHFEHEGHSTGHREVEEK